jgi:hypothetical protein
MDLLKAEIDRKRREAQELLDKKRKESGQAQEEPKKKYVRRGDIEKEREKKYLEEQEKVTGM